MLPSLIDITSLKSSTEKNKVFLNLWPIMKLLSCLMVT